MQVNDSPCQSPLIRNACGSTLATQKTRSRQCIVEFVVAIRTCSNFDRVPPISSRSRPSSYRRSYCNPRMKSLSFPIRPSSTAVRTKSRTGAMSACRVNRRMGSPTSRSSKVSNAALSTATSTSGLSPMESNQPRDPGAGDTGVHLHDVGSIPADLANLRAASIDGAVKHVGFPVAGSCFSTTTLV